VVVCESVGKCKSPRERSCAGETKEKGDVSPELYFPGEKYGW
jgi:hypothetical protein